MNAALEFHDSDVRSVERRGAGSLLISFSLAYIHRSAGRPGVDNGHGFTRAALLAFTNARFAGELNACSGTLSDGTLVVNGRSSSLVGVPSSCVGNISAQFVFVSGERLNIEASGYDCSAHGEAVNVEAYEA